MNTFDLELFDGHPIIRSDENAILIDTGNPTTIHKENELSFLGMVHEVTRDYMGLDVVTISEQLGMNITTLLGGDIISKYHVLFDYAHKKVSFHEGDAEHEGAEVPLKMVMGVPAAAFRVAGKSVNCFVDTGAKLSYLSEELTEGGPGLGIVRDFYPMIGEFETQTFSLTASLAGSEFSMTAGNLPLMLQMALGLAGADGIIGFDLFNTHRVLMDYGRGVMNVKRSTTEYP